MRLCSVALSKEKLRKRKTLLNDMRFQGRKVVRHYEYFLNFYQIKKIFHGSVGKADTFPFKPNVASYGKRKQSLRYDELENGGGSVTFCFGILASLTFLSDYFKTRFWWNLLIQHTFWENQIRRFTTEYLLSHEILVSLTLSLTSEGKIKGKEHSLK